MPKARARSSVPGLEPLPERARHDKIERVDRQFADSAGAISRPWRVVDTLERMVRAGTISPAMHVAGLQFSAAFRAAAYDPLHARDLATPLRDRSGHRLAPELRGGLSARQTIERALAVLGTSGGPLESIAWHVLGFELSLRDWAARGAWNGLAFDHRVASGVLVGALDVLNAHFTGPGAR